MKRDGGDGMLPFAKRDISEWSSRYEPKIIKREILIRFAGNPHVYQAPESNCFIAARAIRAHEALLNVWTYLLQNFLEITHVKLVWCSKPQYSTQSTCM